MVAADMGNIPLWRYATNTQSGSSHHQAFWNALDDALTPEQKARIAAGGDIRGIWEAQPAEAAPAPPAAPSETASSVLLNVPYEYQNDDPSGWRLCFSSSCAMVAKFYGKCKSDTEYNAIRAKFGDSIDSGAQLRALTSLGLQAQFCQNGSAQTLEAILRDGRPVPVGWLHHGPASAPTGGGHWTVAIGFDADSIIHNDPNGEANLVDGGYVSTANGPGRGVRYSRKNWLRRWEVDGKATGWYLSVRA